MKYSALFLLLAAAQVALAQDKNIHLEAGGKSVGFDWQMTDGAGFTWQINSYGGVSSGGDNVYNQGLMLQVQGSQFHSTSGNARGSADGREIELGPWKTGQVSVYRRVYVDKTLGYCRWIDIFENTSSTAVTLPLQYASSVSYGIQTLDTSSGGTNTIGEKDWAAATSDSGSGRPSLVHVFASKTAKIKPSVQWSAGSNSFNYNLQLNVPAGKTVALCFFEAQRRPYSDAQKLMKEFNIGRELSKAPPALRKLIVNMSGSSLTLGQMELPRNDANDLVVLRKGDELLGTILNEQFVVETIYGKVQLPAERVVGLSVPAADDPYVQVGLTDGQIVAGKLLSVPLQLRLADGNQAPVNIADIKTAAYRLSAQRPEEINAAGAMVALRGGQRLFFRGGDADYTYQTEYGQVKLRPDDLKTILLDTAEGGLHRAMFRSETVLSGLLTAEQFKLQLDLGPVLTVRRSQIERFEFPAAAPESGEYGTAIAMRNDDKLFGRITAEKLTVQTKMTEMAIASADVAEITFQEYAMAAVQVKLLNGTTITGRLKEQSLAFQITPELELPIFVGHIIKVTCPKPKAAPAAVGVPAGATGSALEIAKVEAEIKKLQEMQAQLAANGKLEESKAMLERIDVSRKKLAVMKDEAAATAKRDAESAAASGSFGSSTMRTTIPATAPASAPATATQPSLPGGSRPATSTSAASTTQPAATPPAPTTRPTSGRARPLPYRLPAE